MALTDGTPYYPPRPSVEQGVIIQGAIGVQSSVANRLMYAQELMEAADDHLSRSTSSTAGSPSKQVVSILQNNN